jgi:tetratricopeptide (TPR) repeat protein
MSIHGSAFIRISGLFALTALQLAAQYDSSSPAGQGIPRAGATQPGASSTLGYPVGAPIQIKVVLEDGAALSSPPMVILSTGTAGASGACSVESVFLTGIIRLRLTGKVAYVDGRPVFRCGIWKLSVPGYRTFSGFVSEGSVITLSRLGEHEGAEISLTTLSAPPAARHAYDKGEAAITKKKWPDAEKHFEEAVAIYPAYAPAWSELGNALSEQNRLDDAMNALQKARAADPKYIKPIVQMAGVEGRQEHWEEELHTADEALAMHPVSFPGAYYYHAEACYHLGLLDDAVQSVHTAIETDMNLELPEAHFLAGLVLAREHQRSLAVQEFQQYLQMAPKGEHAAEAKAHVAELTKRAGRDSDHTIIGCTHRADERLA